MKRLRIIAAGVIAAAAVPAVAAGANVGANQASGPQASQTAGLRGTTTVAQGTPVPPRAQLGSPVCHKSLDPVGRSISALATMRPLTGTQKLAVDFKLLEKPTGALAYAPVNAPGLGHWVSPTAPSTLGQLPGDVWYVKHPVVDLDAPASYRFDVQFRWYGRHGKVIGSQSLQSSVCVQLELRPDLTVQSIAVEPIRGAPLHNRYVAVIANTGATGAGSFTVELSDHGQVVDKTVQRLGAHASRTVSLIGPACQSSQPPTVTADPEASVDVYTRVQATATATCPAPAGGFSGTPVSG